tara:strand:+ start:144 stop:422 length:279 start_codon:yes stop_codon:yes gene_type:complete
LESDVSSPETESLGVVHCCRNFRSALFWTQETIGDSARAALFSGLKQMHVMRVLHFIIFSFFSLFREFSDSCPIHRKHSHRNGGLICGKKMA